MVRVRSRKPKVRDWEGFLKQTLGMADTSNPNHVAELISQIMAQLESLGDHIYNEDGYLHYDEKANSNAHIIEGLAKKLRRAVDWHYLQAHLPEDKEETA